MLPKVVTQGLCRRGVDVLTAQEANMLGASDYDHIVFAKKNKRVIFTQDVDFIRLHKINISHRGIIYAPQQITVGRAVRGLMMICDLVSLDEMRGRVEFLDR
ncbi:MAG: DUF5615 family PIN-like protein [Candidatus Anammoxibacter sp.]